MRYKIIIGFIVVVVGYYYFAIRNNIDTNWHNIKENKSAQYNKSNYIENINEEEIKDEFDISSLRCDEILTRVTEDGDLIQQLNSDEINSSAIEYAAFWEFDGKYFAVIEFKNSGQSFIYCDINRSNWDAFYNNDEGSYGKGYHAYIKPNSNCNCD